MSGGSYTGDLINFTGSGIAASSGTLVAFASNPTALGDYRLFGGSFGSPTLSNFTLPTPPINTITYSLNPSIDAGFIDLVVASAGPITSAWTSTTADVWSTAGKWTAGVPSNAGDTAAFDNTLNGTANGSVTLDGNRTIGHLQFNNSAISYTIAAGTGTLTIDNSGTGSTGVPSIDVTAGSHTIAAPVTLAAGVTITTAADPMSGPALTISGSIGGTGGITKAGPGTFATEQQRNQYVRRHNNR